MSKSESPTLDFMGREITAGSTVIYPVRRGSQMWMQELSVTQVVGGTSPIITGFNPSGRKITLHNVGNVTVVQPRVRPSATAAGRLARLQRMSKRTGGPLSRINGPKRHNGRVIRL
jgi:hypothetical protein